ncbi:MAG: U32 family peptidase [Alphaproteobacteria bacterium]|nr:U32 family peptidase [Alphaproteobacteria bacterium]
MKLTLGPVLFNWPPGVWRDFYFRIADEAPVETVYLGEVICSKRLPFFETHLPDVAERLAAAGKTVVLSSLALVMNKRDARLVRDLAADENFMVEANDVSSVAHLAGRPHVIGPLMNVYNEDTMDVLAADGAVRFCLPPELPASRIEILAEHARRRGVETEVFAYGRAPLALSARCYHARIHGLAKDNCQFVCSRDPDGVSVTTLDEQPFMTVNGIQTLSHSLVNLAGDLRALRQMNVTHLRLSPRAGDMVAVAQTFRDTLDGVLCANEAFSRIVEMTPEIPPANGFFRESCGHNAVKP